MDEGDRLPANASWDDAYDYIETMLESGKFDWAIDALTGIQETISDRESVTDQQVRAIRNIANARGWN